MCEFAGKPAHAAAASPRRSALSRLAWQGALFADEPNRLALLRLGGQPPEGPMLRIFRNHAVEGMASVLAPFQEFACYGVNLTLGKYDDTLSLPDAPYDAALVWLDFDRYPRPIDDDLRCCEQAGVDVVYAPVAATMYPTGFATSVSVTELTEMMEGASRPGHFDGVTTVVTKLFAAAKPHLAVFGEKDYQQLAIVRRMTRDLDLGIDIVAHPTVREADGLALSSRNQRLSARDREAAACIPAAIRAAIDAASLDSGGPAAIIEVATRIIESEPLATLDYVALFDADTLHPIDDRAWLERTASRVRIAIAASIGEVRLIDNAALHLA